MLMKKAICLPVIFGHVLSVVFVCTSWTTCRATVDLEQFTGTHTRVVWVLEQGKGTDTFALGENFKLKEEVTEQLSQSSSSKDKMNTILSNYINELKCNPFGLKSVIKSI